MRVVLQRVTSASVSVKGDIVGEIGKGFLLFAGFSADDTEALVTKVSEKIVKLRLFSDINGKINLSIGESGGSLLLVSQFTLYADLKKGNRPSFNGAAPPQKAEQLYHFFQREIERLLGKEVPSGIFGAEMAVSLVNDGPVTIVVDTEELNLKG